MKRRMSAMACALLAIAVPLSCSGSDGSSSGSQPPRRAETTTSAPKQGGTKASPTSEVDPVPALKNPVGIFKDVTLTSCDAKTGPVTAKGKVRNTGNAPADIAITVGWAKPTGNTISARGAVVLKAVGPGEEKEWSIDATVNSTEPVQCVVGAQRGDPQG
jgi:hypothetical protein